HLGLHRVCPPLPAVRSRSTTQNRGVPGSSPGLAIREPPAIGEPSQRGRAEKIHGARDSPTGADWITIASVVLEPRVENGLRDVRVAIVGAGFGGIGTAIRLREAGYEDVVILERGDGLGGTWWANT